MADVKAEKKIIITDLNKAIAQMERGSEIAEAIKSGFIKASIAEVKVEAGKYSGDYVKLVLGDSAKTDNEKIETMILIAGGNLDQPFKKDADGNETEEIDERAESLTKHFFYGNDLAARSATSQAIKRAAQGPEKQIEKMADLAMKMNPNLTREKALAKAAKMAAELADDSE